MSKLTDFYVHKESFKDDGQPMDPQWLLLEEQLINEEILPELMVQLKTTLAKVKSPLMLNVSYDPKGCLSISFTRCCAQTSVLSGPLPSDTPNDESSDEQLETTVDDEETQSAEKSDKTGPKFKKSKSIGFSVSFSDGTVYHEKKAKDTWINALKKIGLETIYNNRSLHQAWHQVSKKDVCIVETTETVRDSDKKSPQTLVDGFYVMTQLSNEQKEKDLLALSDFMPKLGIKFTWDDEKEGEVSKETRRPVIDEDAANYNLPIKRQFLNFLRRTKAEGTAISYTSTLDNAVRKWVNQDVDDKADSVFSYTTTEDVKLCIDILKSSPAFIEENDRKHHSMSAALEQYLNFIEEREERLKEE